MRVLIVEDIDELRADMVDILTYADYEVFQAENGAIGFEIWSAYSVDIIISDYHMPEMTGVEIFSKIQEVAKNTRPKFILVTAKPDTIETSLIIYIDKILHKPSIPPGLLQSQPSRFPTVGTS